MLLSRFNVSGFNRDGTAVTYSKKGELYELRFTSDFNLKKLVSLLVFFLITNDNNN